MAELKDVINKRCPVEFEWKGLTIRLAYRPFHERLEQEIKGEEDWTLDSMTKFVAAVATDWDLTSDGEPLPVSEEILNQLAPQLRMNMWIACRQDLINPQLPNVISTAS